MRKRAQASRTIGTRRATIGERIYISYDSTSKHCEAGDLRIVEMGHAKDREEANIFNYAVAYDNRYREPLFYELYSGSINDMSQL